MIELPESMTVLHGILLAALGLAQKRGGSEEILDTARLQSPTRTAAEVKQAVRRLSPAISIRKKEIDLYLKLLRDKAFARNLEQSFSGNLENMLAADPAVITNPITLLNCPLQLFEQQFPGAATAIATFISPDLKAFRLALLVYANINGLQLESRDLDSLHTQLLQTGHPPFPALILDGLHLLPGWLGGDPLAEAYQSFADCMDEADYQAAPQKAGI